MSEQTIVANVRVKNELGIHTRPATHIVKLLQDVHSDVHFTYNKERVNAKSILGILTLAAPKNAQITIEVCGEDAEDAMRALLQAFEEAFGEDRVHGC